MKSLTCKSSTTLTSKQSQPKLKTTMKPRIKPIVSLAHIIINKRKNPFVPVSAFNLPQHIPKLKNKVDRKKTRPKNVPMIEETTPAPLPMPIPQKSRMELRKKKSRIINIVKLVKSGHNLRRKPRNRKANNRNSKKKENKKSKKEKNVENVKTCPAVEDSFMKNAEYGMSTENPNEVTYAGNRYNCYPTMLTRSRARLLQISVGMPDVEMKNIFDDE